VEAVWSATASDPPGTRVRLRVHSGSAEREIVLTLRDLV
jgi:hypothetical protein